MSAVASVRAVQARIASIESRFGAPAPWSRTDFTVKAQPVATQPVATEPVTGRTMPAPTAAAPVFPDVMARAVTSADAPYGASPADDGESVPAETPFAAEFVAAGRRHGISPTILAAVGYVESAYQPHVVSPAGAIGLMQL
ncbi:MAG: transglycosylase SLT domain-containing protein, partial [Ilumatobacteraceae bacterium]